MRKERVDILILSRNRSHSLFQTVASIREFTKWPYRIIIQDHASDQNHRIHIKRLKAPDCETYFLDKFLSCNEGRRFGLKFVHSQYVAFIDDDVRVGKDWLFEMMRVMHCRPDAAAVTSNVLHDKGRKESGVRNHKSGMIRREPWGYVGQGIACLGGATLYRTDALHRTSFSSKFNGGFEDWDQTLQLTQEQGYTIWGSNAGMIHLHQQDSVGNYSLDRWRWVEVMDAAIEVYRKWGILEGMRTTMQASLARNVRLRPEQWDAVKAAGL